MQKAILVLACLAHHAHAREVGKNIDAEDNNRAVAALLYAVNPSAAVMVPGVQQLQTTQKAAIVQGKSLKTWSYRSSIVDQVQVVLSTDGRPLDADVQLWQGPDNTPCKMRVYSEDGNIRPFSAVIATPDEGESTVAVRNVGENVFPLSAYVVANDVDEPLSDFRDTSEIVQGGGALKTYEFDSRVDSVEILLKTDGRPLNARVELLEGPNNIKQVIELYTEDGLERPFFAIVDTNGMGNVVRVVNTAPMEFPMFASVEPHNVVGRSALFESAIGQGNRGQRHVSDYKAARQSQKHFSWGSRRFRRRSEVDSDMLTGATGSRGRFWRRGEVDTDMGTGAARSRGRFRRRGEVDEDMWTGAARSRGLFRRRGEVDADMWTDAARKAAAVAALWGFLGNANGPVRRWS